VSDDLNEATAKTAKEIAPVSVMTASVFQLEDAGAILLLVDDFSCLP
jgi:hypothetical protein